MERFIPVAHTRPKPPSFWLLFLKAGYKRAVLGLTKHVLIVLGTISALFGALFNISNTRERFLEFWAEFEHFFRLLGNI